MAVVVTEIQNVVVGQYLSGEASFKLTTPGAGPDTYTLPGVHEITGIKSFESVDSGNNLHSDGADVTFSGAVLTIADGTGYDHSAAVTIWVTVFCLRKV